MQLLNHHQRPWDAISYGYAIIIFFACFILKTSLAEYDCSAKDDGWYYDPEYCHVYWRCTHGSAEEFECASGTAWDHRENRCNWLDSVDCSRAETTTVEVHSEEEEEGVEENPDEDEASVVVISKPKNEPKKKTTKKRKPTHDDDEDIDLSSLIVCQANLSAETFCAGRDGFFADPDYCTRYYRCAHGVDQGFECPRGTAWDEETKSCAWIEQVNCDQKKADYSTSTTTKGSDTTTSRKKPDTESESSLPSVISPTHGKGSSSVGDASGIECQPTGIYTVPDPAECNAYYQCDKGLRTRLNCAERQLFDADKHQCMEYERVSCGTRAMNLADKNQCINKRDGIHPDTERDCRFYYQCVSQNKMREAKCPGDQKFSSYTSKCGPASNVPMPCGTYIPGSATILYHRNLAIMITFVLTIIIFIGFDL